MKRDLDDDDPVAADGEFLRVPMMICDSAARDHQPGYRSGARYQRAYADYCRDAELPHRDARAAARDARTEMIRRACESWRRDAAEPDAAWRTPLAARPQVGSTESLRLKPDEPDAPGGPEERLMRRHLFGPDDNAKLAARLERERARDFQRRSLDLQNAWRSPGLTNPNAAAGIERQRRQWTNEPGAA